MHLLKVTREFFSNIFRSRILLAFHLLGTNIPWRLFVVNRAVLLKTDRPEINENNDPKIVIKIADNSDIDDIMRVCEWSYSRVSETLKEGSICFMAGFAGKKPSAVAWIARGKCYVRGIGLKYDFGDKGNYSFGLYTMAEDRRKGLNQAIASAISDFTRGKNIDHFYSLVEFTNEYSLNLHLKMGYKEYLKIFYLRLWFLRFCHLRNVSDHNCRINLFIREPAGYAKI